MAQEFLLIHPDVGYTLDLEEKVHYQLFPDIDNFWDAQFYMLSPESIRVQIRLWEKNESKMLFSLMTTPEFYQLRAYIASRPRLSDEERQQIHRRYQPLFIEHFLSDIPEGAYCRLKLRNKAKFEGIYYRFKGDFVQLWHDKNLKSFPKNEIATLKYWTDYHEQVWTTYFSCISGGLAGYLLATGITRVIPLTLNDATLLTIGGAAVGSVLGYRLAPWINDLTLPAVKIEFRKARIKRLDIFYRTYYNTVKIKDRLWQILSN